MIAMKTVFNNCSGQYGNFPVKNKQTKNIGLNVFENFDQGVAKVTRNKKMSFGIQMLLSTYCSPEMFLSFSYQPAHGSSSALFHPYMPKSLHSCLKRSICQSYPTWFQKTGTSRLQHFLLESALIVCRIYQPADWSHKLLFLFQSFEKQNAKMPKEAKLGPNYHWDRTRMMWKLCVVRLLVKMLLQHLFDSISHELSV